MKFESGRKIAGMLRAAAVMLCVGGLAVAAAQAQDQAPPAPPAGQQQGPPPGGAGGRGGGMMNPDRMTERLTKALDLTADQQTQVKAIYTAMMEKMKSSPDMSREDRRAAREAVETKIKAVLTPDQQTKYADLQAKMRQRGGGGGGEQGPPPSTPPPGV